MNPERNGISGILLAAGSSKRMGQENKLLMDLGGVPMIRLVAKSMLASKLDNVFVVLGYQANEVSLALDGLPLELVFNKQFSLGQGHSVVAGLNAISNFNNDVLIALGDMPNISPSLFNEILDGHLVHNHHKNIITVPTYESQFGNPIIWGASFIPELMCLEGDIGGKKILQKYPQSHNLLEVSESGILYDIDISEDLAVFLVQ